MMIKNTKSEGVTLVEMAIVLVIGGMMLGAVLKGQTASASIHFSIFFKFHRAILLQFWYNFKGTVKMIERKIVTQLLREQAMAHI